jgi:hypothetical protein
MKKLLLFFSTLFFLTLTVSSQTVPPLKKPPLKGTYLKAGKLYIAEGYKGTVKPDGRVIIMKAANNGATGAISGTYVCMCKSIQTGGSDDCKTLVSGDMLDCYSKDGKCDRCLLMVSTEKSLALKNNNEMKWAILDMEQ